MTLQLHRKNYLNNIFLIRNHGSQKKWHNVLQLLKEKKKKRPTQNPIFSRNILRKRRCIVIKENKGYLFATCLLKRKEEKEGRNKFL